MNGRADRLKAVREKVSERAFEEAETALTALLKQDPNNSEAYALLGVVHLKTAAFEAAIAALAQADRLVPNQPNVLMHLGEAYQLAGYPAQAADCYLAVLDLDPNRSAARVRAAVALVEDARIDDAEKVCLQGIQSGGSAAPYLDVLADIALARGDRDAARVAVEAAVSSDPSHTQALLKLVSVAPHHPLLDRDALLDRLEAPTCCLEDVRNLGFVLGRLFQADGAYDRSFRCFRRGNEAHARLTEALTGPYEPAVEDARVTTMIERYSEENIAQLARPNGTGPVPIFVLGMMRSGTTLAEQILSAHPRVFGAGERTALAHVQSAFEEMAVAPDGRLKSVLPAPLMKRLRTQYFDGLPNEALAHDFIVDKTPLNYRLIGLIGILFPEARIVHCQRHPLDVILSNYFQIYTAHFNFSTRLDSIAHYYRQYERLMAHWQGMEPFDIHALQHGALVADPEHEIRRLLDVCGLAWDEACLNFHQSSRAVYTPSQMQVREPINRRGVGMWEHYRDHLGALVGAFGE
ncbi:MAG: sulfotransferase [Pseudomonadota bacterium]